MNIWQKLRHTIIEGRDLETGEQIRAGRPLIVLAPMADVTDVAFRTLIAECGNPDMMWTEFVSADGLCRATPEGKAKLLADLQFGENEHPIVAQLFGSTPEYMERAAYLVAWLGYDGIDLNMGCPDRSIEKQGAGAGMIKNPAKAKAVIRAAKAGALRAYEDMKAGKTIDDIEELADILEIIRGQVERRVGAIEQVQGQVEGQRGVGAQKNSDESVMGGPIAGGYIASERIIHRQISDGPIAVSVKTRIGYNKNELDTWLPALLEEHPALITVHARTRKEMSLVPARWQHVAEAVAIRDRIQADLPTEERTLIFGNGDVIDAVDGLKKAAAAGADGAMLGRALFGNPWLFEGLKNVEGVKGFHFQSQAQLDSQQKNVETFGHSQIFELAAQHIPSTEEKLKMAIRHTELFAKYLGDIKNFAIMKKHFKAYINGFDGAKELRTELMEKAEDVKSVCQIIEEFLVQ